MFAISWASRVRVCGGFSFTGYIVVIEFGLIFIGTISAVRVANRIRVLACDELTRGLVGQPLGLRRARKLTVARVFY